MAKITRIQEVKKALAMAKAKHAKALYKGVYKAGLHLQRRSQKLVPVQTGVLKASAGTDMEGTGLTVSAVVFYATDYAIYVHENEDAAHGEDFNRKYAVEIERHKGQHKYWFNRGPKQQAKFLETPLREDRTKLRRIISYEIEVAL